VLREASDAEWRAALLAAEFVPLQQTAPYAAALRKRGRRIARLVAQRDGAPLAFVQAATRSFGPMKAFTLAARGPVFADPGKPEPAALAGLATPLSWGWPHLLLLAPELAAGDAATAALRAARLRPLMTGAAVALLDLAGDPAARRAALHQKWRNRLAKAEGSGLRVEIARGGRHLEWLLDAHRRLMGRKRFQATPGDFVADALAAAPAEEIFVAVALRRATPVAGGLALRAGRGATWWVAAAEPEGREAHAGNLVLWRAAQALAEAGVATLDLGQLDTDRSPALARFKLGTGARVVTLAGTWTPFPF